VTRVLRVIARMNIGGPAHHVSLLSGRLDPGRFRSRLAYGRPAASEGSFAYLAEREGCFVEVAAGLGPELRPPGDLRALFALMGVMHRFQPRIVHTHTAKAGFFGRLAAVLGPGPRPIIVHTYHGPVLEGYFGPRATPLDLRPALSIAGDHQANGRAPPARLSTPRST
jgi:hypothetical protein